MGSKVITKAYLKPETTKGGVIVDIKRKRDVVPCVELMAVGPDVKHAKVGQWGLLNTNCTPAAVIHDGEMYHLIQEYDIAVLFDEQPDLDDIVGSDTSIVRDLTDYVRFGKMKALKAKVSEGYEHEFDSDGNRIVQE
jgi:hypothetical protein